MERTAQTAPSARRSPPPLSPGATRLRASVFTTDAGIDNLQSALGGAHRRALDQARNARSAQTPAAFARSRSLHSGGQGAVWAPRLRSGSWSPYGTVRAASPAAVGICAVSA